MFKSVRSKQVDICHANTTRETKLI